MRDLRSRYFVQESFLKITKINSDALQSEISLLHELLRKDVLGMIQHIGNLDDQNQTTAQQLQDGLEKMQKKDDPSESLIYRLKDLNRAINVIENEQVQKESSLTQMGGLIKAMLKGQKQDVFTQVDEGDLVWYPYMVNEFNKHRSFVANPESLEFSSVGVNDRYLREESFVGHAQRAQLASNKDFLLLKEIEMKSSQIQTQESGRGAPQQRKQVAALGSADNWNLPLGMIIFMENVTQQNEKGKVLPWQHFKKMVYDIYQERLQFDWQVRGTAFTNTVQLEEFVLLYFLRKFKLRRTAELKLFEFLISLRYYMKTYSRAITFALLCGISIYPPQTGENYQVYKFDVYLQNFFLYAFGRLVQYQNHFLE